MNNILKQAIKAAKQAGKTILEYYQQDYQVEQKQDGSPVTQADLMADKIIIENLKQFNWPILSEESKDDLKRLHSDRVWIVDSLDGTQDFIQKTGEFSLMIGLVEKNRPILGVVYQPIGQKIYYAQKDQGAWLQIEDNEPKKLQVSKISTLDKARLVVSRNHFTDKDKNLVKCLNITNFKQSGSNGIKMGLIANKQADIFFNTTDKMSQWDSCAPEIILIEASGQVTDIRGEKIKYNIKETKNKYGLVASNGILHKQLIENLKANLI